MLIFSLAQEIILIMTAISLDREYKPLAAIPFSGENAVEDSRQLLSLASRTDVADEQTYHLFGNNVYADNITGKTLARAVIGKPVNQYDSQGLIEKEPAVEVVSNLLSALNTMAPVSNSGLGLINAVPLGIQKLYGRLSNVVGAFFTELARRDPNKATEFVASLA